MKLSLALALCLVSGAVGFAPLAPAPASSLALRSAAPHAGQVLASKIKALAPNASDKALVAAMAAAPVVELRGAIPFGAALGLPLSTVLPISLLGNLAPILPLLLLLNLPPVKTLFGPLLSRAQAKLPSTFTASNRWAALAFFVGVPLPGTGAWTGALAAFAAGMPALAAFSAIAAGVVGAGGIVTAFAAAGRAGGVAALVLLAGYCLKMAGGATSTKQDFLEASPHWDQSAVPVNTAKPKEPFTGKVVSTKRIVGPKATGETCHIVIDHAGKLPYWEGQSFGVIPPGEKAPGKNHAVRLYSIASSRYGDDMTGNTASLCVRRATYWDPELKADDPAKKGICSNFLCDTSPGDAVSMTGPSGKVMLMPEENPDTDLIMVATGTGIAPYRSFIRRLFAEKTPAAEAYKGEAWLFLGVANSDALLYDDEWQEAKANPTPAGGKLRLDYALSREQENKKGGKMYIQDKVEEYADEIFNKLDSGAHIYFCGLKGMMPGIVDMLKGVCEGKGIEYDEWNKGLKKNKQWHVEVY